MYIISVVFVKLVLGSCSVSNGMREKSERDWWRVGQEVPAVGFGVSSTTL